MKNKNGFTLIELISVISILLIVAGIFSINMIKILNNNKEKDWQNITNTIISAADAYVSSNPERIKMLYRGAGYVDITLGELKEAGLINKKLVSPETGEELSDDEIVRARLYQGDLIKFYYPVNDESDSTLDDLVIWNLYAEDLEIDYDSSINQASWCEQNKFIGLIENPLSDYSNISSKLYIEYKKANDNEGYMYNQGDFVGSYFGPDSIINLQVTSCNVNPQKMGTYKIEYKYTDPYTLYTKTKSRTVTVNPSGHDVISFEVVLNNNKKIIKGSSNIPVKIVEKYRNTSLDAKIINTTASGLSNYNYSITGLNTNLSGTAIVNYTGLNSDNSKPNQVSVNYNITSSLADVIEIMGGCTKSNSTLSYCYFRGPQNNNYVSYAGHIYRIYYKSSNNIGIIFNGTSHELTYRSLTTCSSNCFEGRDITNNFSWAMESFYRTYFNNSEVKVDESKIVSNPKFSIMTKALYSEISSGYSTNYVIENINSDKMMWLYDEHSDYEPDNRNSKYGAYVYNYTVKGNGEISYSGAHAEQGYSPSFGYYHGVETDKNIYKPILIINNPLISSGDGTADNPYVIY